jgi:bleomycin hydrolase
MNYTILKKGFFALLVTFLLSVNISDAKNKNDKNKNKYLFTTNIEIPTTSVKDQASSGTCWSFATTSFIESEIIRLGKGAQDISEMYFVRYTYPDKAQKYIRYHGFANFSEGGQGHDVMNTIKKHGMVPEQIYSGLCCGINYHKHGEMVDVLSGILSSGLENKNGFSGKCLEVFNAGLDIYLGKVPEKFIYNNNEYTPESFAFELGIIPENYVELTSYSIYPFFTQVDLEIPDNWSHGMYYNIPIDDLMAVINNAFNNGYSVNWDGDVSDKGFSHKKGIAILHESEMKDLEGNEQLKWEALSEDEKTKLLYDFTTPRPEKKITQETRQVAFDKFNTTDDHLMHLIGTATDQNGTQYFTTKNSWADDSNDFGGKLYMSESYIKLKTVAIQVHKDAIPPELKSKLKIE